MNRRSSSAIPVGLSLQPDDDFLGLLDPIICEHIDYAEIAPETTWWPTADGALVTNRFHEQFAALIDTAGLFAVAHGVGMSMATASTDDQARQQRWLERIRDDQQRFAYRWYSDHLGASSLAGMCMMLPMPMPMTEFSAHIVQDRLRAMQSVIGDVGIENSAFYFMLGTPLAEADFLTAIVHPPGLHLVLDLHNLYTLSVNTEVDIAAYLARLPWSKVIEIHLSGGADSDPAWLPGGQTMRLDSHDHAVPEPVWSLLDAVLPRCRNLRGITVERMEGTVTPSDVPLIAEEIHRARSASAKLR
ncbi:MAG: DUF692 family multinuclear iron-containing protein [Myxococcota bacterium]